MMQAPWSQHEVPINGMREPCFAGVVATVTSFEVPERLKIQASIINGGGIFSPDLVRNVITHLIANDISSKKYRHAIDWGNVHVVSKRWVFDSESTGVRQDEERYRLTSGVLNSNATAAPHPLAHQLPPTHTTVGVTLPTYSHDAPDPSDGCLFMDWVRVHLVGCTPQEQAAAVAAVREGGATREGALVQGLTHIVIGSSACASDLAAVAEYKEQWKENVAIVKPLWLTDAVLARKPLPPTREHIVPLGGSGPVGYLSLESRGSGPVGPPGMEAQGSGLGTALRSEGVLGPVGGASNFSNGWVSETTLYAKDDSRCGTQAPARGDAGGEDSPNVPRSELFRGSWFTLAAVRNTAEAKDADELIRECGGQFFNHLKIPSHAPIFAVCPPGLAPADASELASTAADFAGVPPSSRVTLFWLEMCKDQNKVLPRSNQAAGFHPLPYRVPVPAFQSIRVSASQLSHPQKQMCERLLQSLGAKFDNVVNKLCTHLIMKTAEGDKCKFALAHGIPIVNTAWLLESAAACRPLEPEKYLLPGLDPAYLNGAQVMSQAGVYSSQALQATQMPSSTQAPKSSMNRHLPPHASTRPPQAPSAARVGLGEGAPSQPSAPRPPISRSTNPGYGLGSQSAANTGGRQKASQLPPLLLQKQQQQQQHTISGQTAGPDASVEVVELLGSQTQPPVTQPSQQAAAQGKQQKSNPFLHRTQQQKSSQQQQDQQQQQSLRQYDQLHQQQQEQQQQQLDNQQQRQQQQQQWGNQQQQQERSQPGFLSHVASNSTPLPEQLLSDPPQQLTHLTHNPFAFYQADGILRTATPEPSVSMQPPPAPRHAADMETPVVPAALMQPSASSHAAAVAAPVVPAPSMQPPPALQLQSGSSVLDPLMASGSAAAKPAQPGAVSGSSAGHWAQIVLDSVHAHDDGAPDSQPLSCEDAHPQCVRDIGQEWLDARRSGGAGLGPTQQQQLAEPRYVRKGKAGGRSTQPEPHHPGPDPKAQDLHKAPGPVPQLPTRSIAPQLNPQSPDLFRAPGMGPSTHVLFKAPEPPQTGGYLDAPGPTPTMHDPLEAPGPLDGSAGDEAPHEIIGFLANYSKFDVPSTQLELPSNDASARVSGREASASGLASAPLTRPSSVELDQAGTGAIRKSRKRGQAEAAAAPAVGSPGRVTRMKGGGHSNAPHWPEELSQQVGYDRNAPDPSRAPSRTRHGGKRSTSNSRSQQTTDNLKANFISALAHQDGGASNVGSSRGRRKVLDPLDQLKS